MMVTARDLEGRLIASALNFFDDRVLYGRYWGCSKYHSCLHYELCYYQAIDYALKNRIKKVEAGAQGEHKISRGYLPSFVYSLHWFSSKSFASAISEYLEKEEKVIKAIGVGVNNSDICKRFAEEGEFDCILLAGRNTLLDQSALDDCLPIVIY